MKTDSFTGILLVVIAVLLACNLLVSWKTQTVHANTSYTVEPFVVSGYSLPTTFPAQGQIVAIACDAQRCVAVEK
jgi:hypothetical protein